MDQVPEPLVLHRISVMTVCKVPAKGYRNMVGSEAEYVRHALYEVVLSQRGIDFNSRQSQARRFLAQDVREHPIAFEQIAQGSFRIRGLGEKSPRRSAAFLNHCLTELRRREQPDGTTRFGQERFDELWQQSKSLDDDTALARQPQDIFNYQIKALAAKPVERLEHGFRRTVKPSPVHVHGQELVQERAVFG